MIRALLAVGIVVQFGIGMLTTQQVPHFLSVQRQTQSGDFFRTEGSLQYHLSALEVPLLELEFLEVKCRMSIASLET
jgi:hypothetical protein